MDLPRGLESTRTRRLSSSQFFARARMRRKSSRSKTTSDGFVRSYAVSRKGHVAGPCGYALQRQLQTARIKCDVIAPSLIPKKPGERVKTDSRDARKLAELYRAGVLTVVG